MNLKAYLPAPEYCTDNAAMIASAGYFLYKRGETADLTAGRLPKPEISEVDCGCGERTAENAPSAFYYLHSFLPSVICLLLSAFCHLPSAICLLSSAFCYLPSFLHSVICQLPPICHCEEAQPTWQSPEKNLPVFHERFVYQ
jgi:hypothetical protein